MEDAIATLRQFNRFFTRHVGALDARFLETEMSLPEARVLFEIAQGEGRLVASDLQAILGMDAGYLSRVLRRFETRGWLLRRRGESDARRLIIELTDAGRQSFEQLDQRQRDDVAATLNRLSAMEQQDLVRALDTARQLLAPGSKPGFRIRAFRPGDMGMIASRQSVLYNQYYGWGAGIEVIEGEVTTSFLRDFKPGREQCWVAEIDNAMAGSIFLTDEGDDLCRLRLLYVEPFARSLGIGHALVDHCIGFAREVGYARMTLWTHTILEAARRIYASRGFEIVSTDVHHDFGEPVQGEIWELDLFRI